MVFMGTNSILILTHDLLAVEISFPFLKQTIISISETDNHIDFKYQ